MNQIRKTWDSFPGIVKAGFVITGGVLAFVGTKKLIAYINKPPPITLPQGGAGLPVVSYGANGQAVFWNPEPLAKALFEVMNGLFTMSGTKDEQWTKLANLPTDDMVVSVYNYFNDKYGKGETLTAWIKGENWYDVFGSGRELALNRLQSLQLG
jgi:hypothetical protein